MTQKTAKITILIWLIVGFILGAVATALVTQTTDTSGTADEHSVLFTYQGEEYTAEQLPPPLAEDLRQLDSALYNQKLNILKQAVTGLHLAREAEQRDLTPQQLAQELLQVEPVSDEEVARFYEANASQINQPLAQVQNQIRGFLMQQRQQEKQEAVIAQLQAENLLEFNLEQPRSPEVRIDTAGRPSKGEASAPVTVIEFADYQCPHCKTAFETLDNLVDANPEQVQLIYMDFPINSSGISRVVAEGGYCAMQQDQFWPYNQLAYTHQSSLSKESPRQFAEELGLDVSEFENCLTSDEARQYVRKSEQQAIALGIRGTPAIFINGQRYQGNDLDRSLEQAIMAATGN